MQSITLGWAKGVVQAALETRQGAFTDILLTFVFSFRNTDSNHVEHFRNDDRTINLSPTGEHFLASKSCAASEIGFQRAPILSGSK